jgi:hypothetical protein
VDRLARQARQARPARPAGPARPARRGRARPRSSTTHPAARRPHPRPSGRGARLVECYLLAAERWHHSSHRVLHRSKQSSRRQGRRRPVSEALPPLNNLALINPQGSSGFATTQSAQLFFLPSTGTPVETLIPDPRPGARRTRATSRPRSHQPASGSETVCRAAQSPAGSAAGVVSAPFPRPSVGGVLRAAPIGAC